MAKRSTTDATASQERKRQSEWKDECANSTENGVEGVGRIDEPIHLSSTGHAKQLGGRLLARVRSTGSWGANHDTQATTSFSSCYIQELVQSSKIVSISPSAPGVHRILETRAAVSTLP